MNAPLLHALVDLAGLLSQLSIAVERPESFTGDVEHLRKQVLTQMSLVGLNAPPTCPPKDEPGVWLAYLKVQRPEYEPLVELARLGTVLAIFRHNSDKDDAATDLLVGAMKVPAHHLLGSDADEWLTGLRRLRATQIVAALHDLVNHMPAEVTEKAAAVSTQRTDSSEVATMPAPDPKKVFIIHGRNDAARIAVEHFLKALGLQPVDFDQLAADQGGTAFIGDIVRAGLERAQGIVALFTPDEYAALRPDHRGIHDKPIEIQRWQARPNVIFEAGMAYGMAPQRTVLVTLGTEVALFSDVAGIHVVRLNNGVQSRGRLRQKLIGMKCDLDQRTDAWTDPARSGDFEICIKQLHGVSPRDPF